MQKYAHLIGALCWLAMPALGQVADAPASSVLPGATLPCVDVTINGHAALSYDCLNRRLAPPLASTSSTQIPDINAVTREPGNRQVGQFNFSAFSHRMGSNLGISVYPQRPPPSPLPGTLLGMPIGTH